MNVPKNSTIKIGDEDWTVIYRPTIYHQGSYKKAIKIPSKREIYLSLKDDKGNEIDRFTVARTLQRAILPLLAEKYREKYSKEEVDEALKEMKK